MIYTYHYTPDLTQALGQPRTELQHLIARETGQRVSWWTLRRKLKAAVARGYLVLPMCEEHDPRGVCLGHRVASQGEE